MSGVCYIGKLAAFPKQNLEVYEVFERVTQELEGEMMTTPDVVGHMVVKDLRHPQILTKWMVENDPDSPIAGNYFSITTIGDVSDKHALDWIAHLEDTIYTSRDDIAYGNDQHIQKKVDLPFVPGQDWPVFYGPLIDSLIDLAGYPKFDWDYETLNNMFQS